MATRRRRGKKKRECLRCYKDFKSAGIWNRICPNCRNANDRIRDIEG